MIIDGDKMTMKRRYTNVEASAEEILNYVDEKLQVSGVAEQLRQMKLMLEDMQYQIDELYSRTSQK
jgi:hypothetical protein